jgi:hypothetical protein
MVRWWLHTCRVCFAFRRNRMGPTVQRALTTLRSGVWPSPRRLWTTPWRTWLYCYRGHHLNRFGGSVQSQFGYSIYGGWILDILNMVGLYYYTTKTTALQNKCSIYPQASYYYNKLVLELRESMNISTFLPPLFRRF